MNLNCLKLGLIAVTAFVSLNSYSQDLIALQAPVDKKLKSVDSLALQKQIFAEQQAQFPSIDLYPTWNQQSVHNYAGATIPESYTFDLTGFCMPTPNTRITSKFGPRRRRMHNGLDVKVQVGDTIVSAFDGKVRMVRDQGRRKGYGLYVVIRHDNGLETIYGHLSKHLVKEDQLVKAGEPIGLGGNTGRSTGSHLHFETRFLGIAINPALMFDFEAQDVVADTYTFRSKRGSYKLAGALATGTSGGSNPRSSAGVAIASKAKSNSNSNAISLNDGVIRYHKVKKGESLSIIANKRGVSIDKLCKLNRINRQTTLKPGQVLRCS